MRYVRDQTGRFPERPHYEPKEIDTMFEHIVVGFLKARHGQVEFPFTTEDLTVLIEQETADLDPYADLSGYGAGVEGVTEFWPGRKPSVKIAKELAESDRRENRYRTTLSHEYGHVRLHGYLFGLGASPGLFDAKAKPGVIACKRDTMLSASRTDWMEWQAAYACGAVLMPAACARAAVSGYREQAGVFGQVQASSDHGQAMIELLVKGFQVSRDAARVRLSVLGLLGAAPAAKSLFG
jgi:hypothetical protein